MAKTTTRKSAEEKQRGGTYKGTREIQSLDTMTDQEVHDLVPLFDNLTEEEVDIWNYLKEALHGFGYLQQVDRYALTMATRDLAKLKEVSEIYLQADITMVSEKGIAGLSAEALAYDFATKRVEKSMNALGLTPRARKIILAGAFSKKKEIAPPMPLGGMRTVHKKTA